MCLLFFLQGSCKYICTFVNKCHTPLWHHLTVMRHSSKTLTQNGLCVWEFSISRCASRVLWAYVIAILVLCHHVEKLWNVVLYSEWSMLQINIRALFRQLRNCNACIDSKFECVFAKANKTFSLDRTPCCQNAKC